MEIKIETDFSLDDLLALVQKEEAEDVPEGYLTTWEWAEWAGRTECWMGTFLQRAFRKGLLDTQGLKRPCRDGRSRQVPGYKFIFREGE